MNEGLICHSIKKKNFIYLNLYNHISIFEFFKENKVYQIKRIKDIFESEYFIKNFQINEDSNNLLVVWQHVNMEKILLKIYDCNLIFL